MSVPRFTAPRTDSSTTFQEQLQDDAVIVMIRKQCALGLRTGDVIEVRQLDCMVSRAEGWVSVGARRYKIYLDRHVLTTRTPTHSLVGHVLND